MAEEESTQILGNQIRGRRLKPRSKVWKHFTRHTGDDGNDTAKCNRCGKVYTYHGTKNLWEHYNEGCSGQESADIAGTSEQLPQPLPSLAQDEAMQQLPQVPLIPLPPPACAPSRHGGSSDRESSGLQEEACRHLARMIALRGYDASVLEDDCFRSFVKSINPEFEVPSRVAIENMCDGIFDEARSDILERLRRAPGKVSVAVGRAKTMEEEILYVACHFIDDGWNLHKLLLYDQEGTGLILELDKKILELEESDRVRKIIQDNEIEDRLFMVAYETTHKDIHHPELKKYFCTDPIRNKILFTTYVENVLHSIARCLIPHHEDFSQKLYSQVKHLPLTRQERLKLLPELDLHDGWAYHEKWYACYCSLEVLCNKGFRWWHLPVANRAITELWCKLWEKIHLAIQKISSSTGPTANLCLAELFKLREILQIELERHSSLDLGDDYDVFDLDNDVTCVLREARNTLDEAMKDSYLVWSLPIALDPHYKLEFISFSFKRVYGLEAAKQWVSNVTTMMTELYADYVEEYGTTDGPDQSDTARAMDTTISADDPWEQAWNEHCRYPEAETELDRYLKDPLAPKAEGFDILNWWKAHSSEYPVVARMARDALAMPTCSKLSSDQMAQLRSILRGYSNQPYGAGPSDLLR